MLKGAILGFLIAAPVGPIGLLCISRTLRAGWTIGFVSGLGAAAADAIYGCIAAFGVTTVMHGASLLRLPLHFGGAALLGWMGLREIRARSGAAAASLPALTAPAAFAGTFGLTLLNPATILSFIAVSAAAIGTNAPVPRVVALLVAGVFCGSAFWWFVLATLIAGLRRVLPAAVLRYINIVSGVLLIAFALYALLA